MSTPPRPSDRQFQIDLELAAAPDAVWRAVSEAREIARWFAPKVEVVPGVGGSMLWDWGGGMAWPHTIEAFEAGRHLRTRYASQVEDGRGGKVPLFVDFHVEGSGGKTKLRLVHSGFGPDARFDDEFDGISRGWTIELLSLRHYLERHLGQERNVAFAIGRPGPGRPGHEGGAKEEAWRTLCGPKGFAANLDGLKEGERLTLTPAPGAVIEGQVLRRAGPLELCANAENLGDGFLRIAVERCMGEVQVWLWLATWGRPRTETERFQRAFDAAVERLYPAAKQPAAEART